MQKFNDALENAGIKVSIILIGATKRATLLMATLFLARAKNRDPFETRNHEKIRLDCRCGLFWRCLFSLDKYALLCICLAGSRGLCYGFFFSE